MYFNQFILLLLPFAGIAHTSKFAGEEAPVQILKSNDLPVQLADSPRFPRENELRCGGVYNTVSGDINYKTTGNILDNERCSWVIGVPRALGYQILITELGSPTNAPGSTQELHLTGITWQGRSSPSPPTMRTYKPTGVGVITVEDSNVVVVTFSTAAVGDGSLGFDIQYAALTVGNITATSPLSTHHVYGSTTFNSHYPESGRSPYDNNELAALLFLPRNGVSQENNENLVMLSNIALEGSGCNDVIHGFAFDMSAPVDTSKWSHMDSIICGNVTDQDIYHDDMMMFLFRSDGSQPYAGFDIGYNTC